MLPIFRPTQQLIDWLNSRKETTAAIAVQDARVAR